MGDIVISQSLPPVGACILQGDGNHNKKGTNKPGIWIFCYQILRRELVHLFPVPPEVVLVKYQDEPVHAVEVGVD
jgi:hypothetical protein